MIVLDVTATLSVQSHVAFYDNGAALAASITTLDVVSWVRHPSPNYGFRMTQFFLER